MGPLVQRRSSGHPESQSLHRSIDLTGDPGSLGVRCKLAISAAELNPNRIHALAHIYRILELLARLRLRPRNNCHVMLRGTYDQTPNADLLSRSLHLISRAAIMLLLDFDSLTICPRKRHM